MSLAAAAALMLHVTAMAQSGGSPILPAVDTGIRGSDVPNESSPTSAVDRVRVPFAGTYRLTLALGPDTADFVLHIGEQGVERSIAAPAPRKRGNTESVPVRALIVPASLSTDSSTVPAAEFTGSITASAADTATSGPGRWWVTILAGVDTDGATAAGRLSRLLLRVQAERNGLARRCAANARGENRAAKQQDEPPLCDEASGLPVATSSTPGDGTLFIGADGHARVEQRTETEGGELTLWGSRIDR